MIIRGTHLTTYTYDAPVTLDRHAIRLQPRTGGDQSLRAFEIRVTPTPTTQTQTLDAEGNAVNVFWFLGPTSHLEIETRFEIENRRVNPFDFIPAPAAALPPQFSPDERELLRPSLKPTALPEIDTLAMHLTASCDGNAFGFALAANRWLNANIEYVVRRHGLPRPPEATLADKKGACRDLAVLLIALCRAKGIPARFVSGYYLKDEANAPHDLHAWAEVWIPGGGWRGLDPTLGLATSERHIAVAASATYAMAAPVTGSFLGNVVSRLPAHAIALSAV
jgi:transglutaminase-like putative cysteine protease